MAAWGGRGAEPCRLPYAGSVRCGGGYRGADPAFVSWLHGAVQVGVCRGRRCAASSKALHATAGTHPTEHRRQTMTTTHHAIHQVTWESAGRVGQVSHAERSVSQSVSPSAHGAAFVTPHGLCLCVPSYTELRALLLDVITHQATSSPPDASAPPLTEDGEGQDERERDKSGVQVPDVKNLNRLLQTLTHRAIKVTTPKDQGKHLE